MSHLFLCLQPPRWSRRAWMVPLLLMGLLLPGCGCNSGPETDETSSLKDGPAFPFPKPTDKGFVTSNACVKCHPNEHASWHSSYHRTMTQPATTETVVAPFDGRELTAGGATIKLEKRGDEFWVNMPDPIRENGQFVSGKKRKTPIPRMDAKVVMTTGSHHMQAYWVEGLLGRELWQVPWRYDIRTDRWMHRKDVFLWRPDDWEPGMMFIRWNQVCIICHSTGGNPGWNPDNNVMDKTEVGELGIACEACHGPGEKHVEVMEAAALNKTMDRLKDPATWHIANPRRLEPQASADVCGRCHSHFTSPEETYIHGYPFKPGDRLDEVVDLLDDIEDRNGGRCYWEDGTVCSGGREYSGLIDSVCFTEGGMTCVSCHSMHNSDPDKQVAAGMNGNRACLQCHQEYEENLEAHTHHPPDSAGSLCYNCHMPYTSFALMKAIRVHEVISPQVKSIDWNVRPNGCNLCHLDQTLDWTAQKLTEWYDQPSVELAEDEKEIAASLLWMLRGDALQRSLATWHYGWKPAQEASGTEWMPPFVAEMLRDDYPVVRQVADRALQHVPGVAQFEFEYDDAPEDRNRTVETLQEQWSRAEPGNAIERPAVSKLLTEPRTLDQSAIRSLIEKRDPRVMRLVE